MSTKVKKMFKIEGMHCTSCAMNIDMELEDLSGIKEAKTSYAKQQLTVVYDAKKVTDEDIIKIVKQIGYTATVLL